MTAHDTSAFLKVDTPANACTTSDRALREAFRASMDAPTEKVGLLDQLNARIAGLKSASKKAPVAAKTPKVDADRTAPAAKAVAPEPQAPQPDVTPADTPENDEGTLFAHLNEIMEEKAAAKVEEEALAEAPQSKSIIVRALKALIPKKRAKAKAVSVTDPAPAQILDSETEAAPKAASNSIILRALSSLKPKPKDKSEAKPDTKALAPAQSGSIVIKVLKAISPIKKSA